MDWRRRRAVAMGLIAVLLIPTGYAMLEQDFRLAAICVVGIILLRLWGIRGTDRLDDD